MRSFSIPVRSVNESSSSQGFFAILCLLLTLDAWRSLFFTPLPEGTSHAVLIADGIVCALAAALIFGIGRPHVRRDVPCRTALLLGALCGAFFFARDLGCALLDPQSIGWLLVGDWAQHYSGWEVYRSASWSWPPGRLPELLYPVGSSIVYTDSLPLLAIPLKAIGGVLPYPFQYIGLWMLVNCILQGLFAAALVSARSKSLITIVAGSLLFLFVPLFLRRLVHETLMAQWVLLAALWLYFYGAKRVGAWCLLVGTTALIHPYLVAMVISIQAATVIGALRARNALSVQQSGLSLALSALVATLLWYLSGSFIIPPQYGDGGVPFGKYSFNLLGFFNPMGYSVFFPDIPVFPDQYEGFAYLGLGIMVLCGFALGGVFRAGKQRDDSDWWSISVVALLLLLLAASTVITVGPFVLVNHPSSNPILGVFRSSGRFVWASFYLLLLAAVWSVLRRYPVVWRDRILVVCLFLQIADAWAADAVIGVARTNTHEIPKGTTLLDARWHDLARDRKHLTLFPPVFCGHQAGPYLPFVLLAAQEHLSVNTGFVARWDAGAANRYCEKLRASVKQGLDDDAIYVVDASWESLVKDIPLDCQVLDNYNVCTVGDPDRRKAAETQARPSP
jgi:hypothetical protein